MSTRPHNQVVKLTKTVVDRAKPPATGQAFLRDSELKGFGLRITATGVKTFIVEKRIDGRSRRKKRRTSGGTCDRPRRPTFSFFVPSSPLLDTLVGRAGIEPATT